MANIFPFLFYIWNGFPEIFQDLMQESHKLMEYIIESKYEKKVSYLTIDNWQEVTTV